MGTTSTPNLTLVKPNPFEEEDAWGTLLNSNFDKIDAIGTVSAKAIAAVTPAADRLPYFTSGTAAAVTTFTAFARTLLDDTSAAAMATTLELGTGDSPQFAGVNIGNATDTTITRSAAGVIAVEGGVIPKENRENTFTASQSVNVNNTTPAVTINQTGTGHALLVEDSTSPDANPFVITNDGSVGVGTNAPAAKLETQRFGTGEIARFSCDTTAGQLLKIVGTTAGTQIISDFSTGINGDLDIRTIGASSSISFSTANLQKMILLPTGELGLGTSAPGYRLDVAYNDADIARFRTTATNTDARVIITANGTGSGVINNITGNLNFEINGSRKVQLTNDGRFLSLGNGGIGYGSGSGGTVTQATSKSTGVSLNKKSGKITMNGAALAANTTVQFTLTNSAISSNDVVIVNISSGVGDGANYNVWATVGSGSCGIYLRNISGSSLSDSPVINFVVIDGSTT